MKSPRLGRQAVLALLVEEGVLPLLRQRHVGVHAVAVDPRHRLGQEAGGEVHLRRDLARHQLVELHLVGGDRRLGVAVVHLELRRGHLGVVLLVGEAEGALHLRAVVDELAQRVAGQRVVVAAGRDELEAARLGVAALGVASLEQEALDLVRDVGDDVLLRQRRAERLEPGPDVAGVGAAVLVLDFAEGQHLARPEDVGRQRVEGRPVDGEAQVGLGLAREAADRRAVEGQVVGRLEQELLVVVEHVHPAFEVGEADRDRLDALLVPEVLEPRLAHLLRILARHAVGLGGEVHLFELVVRDLQEVAQRLHRILLVGGRRTRAGRGESSASGVKIKLFTIKMHAPTVKTESEQLPEKERRRSGLGTAAAEDRQRRAAQGLWTGFSPGSKAAAVRSIWRPGASRPFSQAVSIG